MAAITNTPAMTQRLVNTVTTGSLSPEAFEDSVNSFTRNYGAAPRIVQRPTVRSGVGQAERGT